MLGFELDLWACATVASAVLLAVVAFLIYIRWDVPRAESRARAPGQPAFRAGERHADHSQHPAGHSDRGQPGLERHHADYRARDPESVARCRAPSCSRTRIYIDAAPGVVTLSNLTVVGVEL